MPRAKSTRPNGWRFDASIAAIALAAERSWKPSSASRSSAVEAVEVLRLGDQPLLHQPADELLADPVDVHRAPGDEVPQALVAARRARAVRAVVLRLALGPHDGRVAHRAALGHRPHRPALARLLGRRADHLGDHVAGPLDDHAVALADVLAADVVLVVQRRERHGHPGDVDRLEHGVGVHRAGAADVQPDVQERGQRRRGRELEGDGPTRVAPDRAQRRCCSNDDTLTTAPSTSNGSSARRRSQSWQTASAASGSSCRRTSGFTGKRWSRSQVSASQCDSSSSPSL